MRENISSGEARIRKTICRTFIYLFAVIVAAAAFYPFFVMIISSTHDNYISWRRSMCCPVRISMRTLRA